MQRSIPALGAILLRLLERTMTPEELPPLPIRLTRNQLDCVATALDPIERACANFIREFPSYRNGSGASFDMRVFRLLRLVNDAAIRPCQKFRLRLNAVDAALVAFALRAASKSGSLPTQRGNVSLSRWLNPLMKRIENLRRRARRATETQLGQEAYRDMRSQWTAFRRWLSSELSERRNYPADSMRRYYRQILNFLLLAARRGLAIAGRDVPPDKELWMLIRLALRYARRGRGPFGFRGLADSTEGAGYLAHFITCRWSPSTGVHRKTAKPCLPTTLA